MPRTSDKCNPLMLRWQVPDHPLPLKRIRAAAPTIRLEPAQPWIATGPHDEPFDFCFHMRRLVDDISKRSPELATIDASRILIAVSQARNGQAHGLQARVTPLRFAKGRLTRVRRGVTYQVQRYFLGELEFLYLMTYCLPRFLDQDFDNKFITIFHELYHIAEEFNGDLRRHDGRYELHTHSQQAYDQHMAHLARQYLGTNPNGEIHAFLRLNFRQLEGRHGGVAGIVVPRPRVVPVMGAPVAQEAAQE